MWIMDGSFMSCIEALWMCHITACGVIGIGLFMQHVIFLSCSVLKLIGPHTVRFRLAWDKMSGFRNYWGEIS